jgi:hypothetical protein
VFLVFGTAMLYVAGPLGGVEKSDAQWVIYIAECLGGTVDRAENDPRKPIVGINFELKTTSVLDAALRYFKGLTDLRDLNLAGNVAVTDAGLVYLKGLTHLQTLNLSGTHITDAGIDHLKSLTNLRTLNLSGTPVSGSAVQGLRQALPELEIIQ